MIANRFAGKTVLGVFFIYFCLAGGTGCEFRVQSQGNQPDRPNIAQDAYELLHIGCSSNGNCTLIIYATPSLFDQEGMSRIAKTLSTKYKDKGVVNANLFDTRSVAMAYVAGNRSLGDLQNERRGWYVRTKKKEFLLFFADPTNRTRTSVVKIK